MLEDRFEGRSGRCRGFVDELVGRSPDCGPCEAAFARVRCPECARERA